ncbi:amidase [Terrihabitans rhizophilus]|uniref:Amidase n=1 Tax=Terrihabitans rhizophilus TaxID=3092662 RepID=A0ABU4RVC1_9HYPH|nr:amidase [Terrihabitans sp. PJ23]MDX6806821.1 amidase [Terrihabitans sp. PJ23]
MPRIAKDNADAQRGNYDPSLVLPSFTAARQAFLAGTSTPRKHLEERIELIERLDNQVQAFCFTDFEGARRSADASDIRYRENRTLSPLDGCPMGIKDTIDVGGMPSKMNSRLFSMDPAQYDAAAVFALKAAGAIMVGKTHVPELAFGSLPPTRNPFDMRRTAGGSSSGSGAAVGAGMVPVTIGNQTGGSLIRPASFNANYGFKPSFGALNVAGMHPIAPSQDHIGPMAASLADAWATAWEISSRAGGHNGHPGLSGAAALPRASRPLRLAHLQTEGWAQLDPASLAAFEELSTLVSAAGVSIIDRDCDGDIARLEDLLAEGDRISNDIIMYEVRWPLVSYLDTHGAQALSETAKARLDHGLAMSPADYRRALTERNRIRDLVLAIGSRVDGYITMASSGPAPVDQKPADGHVDRPAAHKITGSRSFLSPWSMVGGPSFSLPLMAVDGMPQGVQLMGLPDTDYRLTAIARWFDEAVLG